MNPAEAIKRLSERGWRTAVTAPASFRLPQSVSARHPKLPHDFVEFLSGLSTCSDQDETTWFLCRCDYEGASDSAFRWDEFEQMSIESANGDPEALAEINDFWIAHLPFMLSVHGGYAFYAIRTCSERFGEIVAGSEPTFEEVSVVAESFSDFLTESQHERLSPIDRDA